MNLRNLLILIILSFSINAYSEDKMRIAVIDLKPNNVSNVLAGGISNMIRSDLVDTGLFVVIERNQMETILKEQELQMSGCTDSTCAVQFGKILSARKILVGDVTKMEKMILITVRIVDVEKGVSEFSSREQAESEDKIEEATSRLTIKLVGRITGKRESELVSKLSKSETGYYMRSIIPGWGQLYKGQKVKGYAFLGSFVLAGAYMGYCIMNYNSAASEYSDMKTGTESEFKAKHDDSVKAAKMVNISIGILALVYTAHWVDILFFSESPPSTAFNNPIGMQDDRCFSFNIYNVPSQGNENYYNASFTKKF